MKIIKYGADYCSPCKVIEPILIEIEEELDIDIERVDIESSEGMIRAQDDNVRALPTILFKDKNDEILNTLVGVQSKEDIVNIINNEKEYKSSN